jgi:hypothetical protein
MPDPTILEANGPIMPFYSSNVCQFDPFYSEFDSTGAILYAKLAETNANYTIELRAPTGELIKTIAGSTTNGEIKAHWNLTDDRGNAYTNDAVQSIFRVTFPDSRSGSRTQTQRSR